MLLDCEDGDLRTTKLFEDEFLIEVCRNGSYNLVCQDNWDHREASVVCRQLNLGDGMYVNLFSESVYMASVMYSHPVCRGI